MLVSYHSLYSGHHHHRLSINVLGGCIGGDTHRKLNNIRSITNLLPTHSFKFSNAIKSIGFGSCNSRLICKNNAMNDRSINGISAEEVVLYEEGGRKRKVKCEVEVVSWRERRVKSEVEVNADVDSVWKALTDYERLADFIPNLIFRFVEIEIVSVHFEIIS